MVRVENATLSKRDIFRTTSLVLLTGDSIDPGVKKTIIDISGRGRLTGIILEWHGVAYGDLKIYLTIDGQQVILYGSSFSTVFGDVDSPPSVGTMYAKPWVIINWDTTNNWYSVSIVSPLSFYSSIKIEFENLNTTNPLNYCLVTFVEKEVGG